MSRAAGGRRVAWGLADQIVSSATSFLVAILAAATLPDTDFGAFALALAICILFVWLSRGLSSDPLSAAHAGDDEASLKAASAASVTTALLVSAAAAAVLALLSIPFFDSILGPVLLMTAAILPAVTLQDNLRYALLVAGRQKAMFVNDTMWLALQVPMVLAVVLTGGSPVLLVAAWGLSAGIAALRALWLLRLRPAPIAGFRAWLARHRTLWPFFVLDNLVFQLTNVALLVVVSALTSLAEVGGMRAAVLLFTPLTVLSRGVVAVFVPEMARRAADPMFVRNRSFVLGLVLVPLTLAWTGAMLLIPDSLGDLVLGDSWQHAEPLVLLTGLTVAIAMFSTGTVVGIRALQAGRFGFTARVVVSVVVLGCASLGAVWDGAYGALLVTVLASPLQVGAWCWLLVKAAGNAPRRDVPDVPDVQEVDR